jgi:anti-sigma regulatory factor (Ser/Thr protein kinase)/CBS domain-containing protein
MADPAKTKIHEITDQDVFTITRVEELAYDLHVGEVMSIKPETIPQTDTMEAVLNKFRARRISGAPVMKENNLAGVVSIEDLIRCLRKSDLKSPVTSYMTRKLITVKATDPVIEALKLFVNKRVGRLIVVDNQGKLTGMLTKGDVTIGLLKALQRDFQAEEIRRYRASHLFEDINSNRTSLILRYNITNDDFSHGGEASANIKRALVRMGASHQLARRVGIAVYEAEMNLIIHTLRGGYIRVEIEPTKISIEVTDDGPGIADVEMAMKPGYSTASQEIRELGFGAGMGLFNIKRCVDKMQLTSEVDKGTRLTMKILLKEEEMVGEGHPTL